MRLPTYTSKTDVLSDAQTVALAGCGKYSCMKDRPNRSPTLCRDCASLYERLLLVAAFWHQRKIAV